MIGAHRLYVGTIGEGLFRSLDGGASYVRACDGMFVECHVRALVVDPRDDRILLMGTEQGLYRTSNGADSWTPVDGPLHGMQIWSIAFAPHNPNLIIVGTCPARIFVSADGGATWREGTVAIRQDCPRIIRTRVTSLLVDVDAPGMIWAGVEIDGLFRSRDAGKTWERVGQGLSSQDIHALAKVSDRTLLAATNNDLNVSVDAGLNWRGLGIGKVMPWSYCRTLFQLPGRRSEVLLGNGDGPPGTAGAIGLSLDGGATWQRARIESSQSAASFQPNSTIWTFACHAADPTLVYAGSVSGQVFRSLDSGRSWEKLAREFGEIRALAWTP
jgi:photosystem II stability/assembly factor-like uncharacterized protein